MVQVFRTRTLVLALSLPFIIHAGRLHAAAPTPLGTLRSDGTVYLGQAVAQPGSTVYNGDLVRTGSSPATISFLQGDLLVLGRQSLAAFQHSPNGCLVSLEKGHLSFTASAAEPISVATDGLTLTRVGSLPSVVEVSLPGDGSVFVAVHRGTLSVANLRPEAVRVEAGQFIKVSPRLAQTQTPGTAAHGKMPLAEKLRNFQIGDLSHNASVAILTLEVGGPIGASLGIVYGLKRSVVSPSTP